MRMLIDEKCLGLWLTEGFLQIAHIYFAIKKILLNFGN